MALMDAQVLATDPDGLAFIADVLGTAGEAGKPGRRFPAESWNPALRLAPSAFCTTLPASREESLAAVE